MKEHASSFNEKLLRECAILQKRLQECSVNFSIEGDKLLLDSPSPADAIDLLNTSNNRIGLLLAEVIFCLFSSLQCILLHASF